MINGTECSRCIKAYHSYYKSIPVFIESMLKYSGFLIAKYSGFCVGRLFSVFA